MLFTITFAAAPVRLVRAWHRDRLGKVVAAPVL